MRRRTQTIKKLSPSSARASCKGSVANFPENPRREAFPEIQFYDQDRVAREALRLLYPVAGAKLELKRRELHTMIADGTAQSAWGYDEFASDLDVESVTHAQADELLKAGREARRVLGSRRMYLAREDDRTERDFEARARRSQQISRTRATI